MIFSKFRCKVSGRFVIFSWLQDQCFQVVEKFFFYFRLFILFMEFGGFLRGRGGILVIVKRGFDFDWCFFFIFCRNMFVNLVSVRIFIKGGKVVNDDCIYEVDVYIENGIIQQVGREFMIFGGVKVIDVIGKLVIFGGIDISIYFYQIFMNVTCVDDFYYGIKVIFLFVKDVFFFDFFCFGGCFRLDLYEQDVFIVLIKGKGCF